MSTSSLSETEMLKYARAWLDRRRRRLEGLEQGRGQIVRSVFGLGPLLASAGVGRAWLYGSWAWGRPHEHSDIDIAVQGIPPTEWIHVWGLVEHRLLDEMGLARVVDLRRIECLPARLQDRVRKGGIAIAL